MRTTYGRLIKTVSGQGSKIMTDRERWIVDKFSFLKGHIARMVSRNPVSLKQKLAQRKGGYDESEESEEDEEEEEGDNPQEDTAANSTESTAVKNITTSHASAAAATALDDNYTTPTTSSTSTKKGGKKKNKTVRQEDLLERMRQNQAQYLQVSQEIRQLVRQARDVTGPVNDKCGWAAFLDHGLPKIHEKIWPQYLRNSMDNYMWALNESETMRANDEQRRPQAQAQQSLPAQQQSQQGQQYQPQPFQSPQPQYHLMGPPQQLSWVPQQQHQQQTQVGTGGSCSSSVWDSTLSPALDRNPLSTPQTSFGNISFDTSSQLSSPNISRHTSPSELLAGVDSGARGSGSGIGGCTSIDSSPK
ncbi:hypothetical protein HOLleu_13462 [Holothuria leucospilota]|uniref:Uncharacterized protein n=1 Tax=Holothuria leucospilota TaxID=206669 RepID=A0A9Q1CCX5_HOLLE|nr:hypothetical protein HOLleu_13462 [Holothuria leucospilota]